MSASNPDYVNAVWARYRYEPSQGAGVVFSVLFGLTTVAHTYLIIRRKSWFFIPFWIGNIFELVGFSCRTVNAFQDPPWTQIPFLLQTILILLAPALFAASIYMILGRIIKVSGGEKYSWIRLKWLTIFFVAGDVISFVMQGAGGGVQASAQNVEPSKTLDRVHMGENIILGGLGVQILFFGGFIVTSFIFQMRMHREPTAKSVRYPWRRHLYLLYAASCCVMIRSIFRVIEYAQGNKGYLMRHEAYFYALDAFLMFVVCGGYVVFHPWVIKVWLDETEEDEKNGGAQHDGTFQQSVQP